MKAFLAGVIAALVIAVGAGLVLQSVDRTAGQAYTTKSTRI